MVVIKLEINNVMSHEQTDRSRTAKGLTSCLRGERDEEILNSHGLATRSQSSLSKVVSIQEPNEKNNVENTSYEKACRRGSAPTTPIMGHKQSQNESNSSSRFANFFSKRSNPLKRTKSVTKLERTKRGSGALRGSRSHESLLSNHAVFSTIDLCSSATEIIPVHQSVLGRRYCFQMRGGQNGDCYYSCGSRQERDLWIYSLRKSITPNRDNMRHIENSLKMWIYEGKNLSPKKKYFCEIYLDKSLFGRTSVKLQTDILFWGDYFDFPDVPDIKVITVNVYREIEKKKKPDKHIYIGSVKIPINEVTSRSFSETWYQISNEKNDTASRNNKEIPTIRIKCRFQSIDVLPVNVYSNFMIYLKNNYKKVCELLEPVICVKAKEDIGQSLVFLMHAQGLASSFLTDVVALDLLRVGDQRLTFRGNSLATKSMEAFLKLTGEQYLQDTLSVPINEIIQSDCDCEVDPTKASGSLHRQQTALRTAIERVWHCIYESHKYFPIQLRACFATFRKRLQELGRSDMVDNLISASIFLRFLCPAILSPSLFYITSELPSSRATRNLTLVAKTLQTLANFTRFQGKESFMEFLNDFLEQEAPRMKEFLCIISTLPEQCNQESSMLDWSGYIDQGKQLSILHSLLSESSTKLGDAELHELDPLNHILEEITKAKEDHQLNPVYVAMQKENENIKSEDCSGLNMSLEALPVQLAPPQHPVVTQPSTSNRGIMRGILTPNSIEKNVFLFNDPTVGHTSKYQYQILNRDAENVNGNAMFSNSPALINKNTKHDNLLSHSSKSQNSVYSISANDQCNNLPQYNTTKTSKVLSTTTNNKYSYPRSSTDNLYDNKVFYPSGDHADKYSYNSKSSTLPRDNNNADEIGDLIQISGLDTNSAFVRKSPTPLLKSNPNYRSMQQPYGKVTESFLVSRDYGSVKLDLGIPDLSPKNDMHNIYQRGTTNKKDINSNSNMPVKLEDLDDLLKYAEENTPLEGPQKAKYSAPFEKPLNTETKSSPLETKIHRAYGVTDRTSPLAFRNPVYQMHPYPFTSQKSNEAPQSKFQPFNNDVHCYKSGNVNILNAGDQQRLKFSGHYAPALSSSSSEEVLPTEKLRHYDGESKRSFNENSLYLNGSSKRNNYNHIGSAGHLQPAGSMRGVLPEEVKNFDCALSIHDQANERAVSKAKVDSLSKEHPTQFHRRLSLESAKTYSDSSTDTEVGPAQLLVSEDDQAEQTLNKSRRSNIYDQSGEIRFLQKTLDTLKNTLDRDEAELRGSNDELFKLNSDKSENLINGRCSNTAGLQSESTMRSIIDRLITMEEELRREQLKMSLALSHKQRVIEEQGLQIEALANSNNRLLCALTALRQRYETQQRQQELQEKQEELKQISLDQKTAQ